MEIPVTTVTQNGVKLYLCSMPAKALIDKADTDCYKAKTNEGYQRKTIASRVNDFMQYIKMAKGISPTSVLLNIRGEIGNFKPITSSHGILSLPDSTVLWIVDGQHRLEGLKKLIEQDPKFSDFPCIAVIMQENTEYEEAKQFLILNKTQKGVKSDLAERLIAKMVKQMGITDLANMPKATVKDIEWRPKADDIVDTLNTNNSTLPTDDFYANPWYQRIQLPNEPKGKTTVSQTAFTNSLKNILESPTFSGYGNKDLSIILVRYWSAILDICPNAKAQPKKFVLQRTAGVAVLHRILPRVIALASCGGGRLTKENFEAVLKKMPDGMTDVFWSTDGLAGIIGTSQKAISILVNKVSQFLEEGNAEQTKELKKPYEL